MYLVIPDTSCTPFVCILLVTPSCVLWMNLRSKRRLDYTVFHTRGKKVDKMDEGTDGPGVAKGDNILTELKTIDSLKFSLEVYDDIEDFDSKSEVQEAMNSISDLIKVYMNVHAELKVELGDEDYVEKYPDYDAYVKKASDFLKRARKQFKEVKDDAPLVNEDQKEILRIEKEILDLKIAKVSDSLDIPNEKDVTEFESFIRNMEAFRSDYFDLSGKSKCLLGVDHAPEPYDNAVEKLTALVKLAKEARKSLLDKIQAKTSVDLSKIVDTGQVLKGQNLSVEISERLSSLETKFSQNLEGLGDYQLLEVSQNKNLESDFNVVLEKITDLAGLVSGGGAEVEKMLTDVTSKKNDVIKMKKNFFLNLEKIVLARDVTADKMKNAASLKIEIPKFSGYDGEIDFYTFKSEFQKLVEPHVKKQLLSDYLKRNYLSGSAFTLVEKESDYSEIWKKLLESFGNARLLLQYKMAGLDAVGGLWKVRDDEKIRNLLAKVTNTMTDLSSLASEHGLEGQLYEGGGLEKVLSLLGEQRHHKFRSKNLDSSAGKKVEWGKLFEFLKEELNLREKIVLDVKNARLMGIDLKPPRQKDTDKTGDKKGDKNDKNNLRGGSAHPVVDGLKCHFCGLGQHAVVTTKRGKKMIPYYVCEIFVALSPSERYSKLKEKNFCTTCLLPGAVKSPKHQCFYVNFCCPHTHGSSEKIHVLLCEEHKGDDKNKALAEQFTNRFVKNCNQNLPQFSKNLSLLSVTVQMVQKAPLRFQHLNALPDVTDTGKFLLQTIQIQNVRLNIFFDNGCGDLVVKKRALDLLLGLGRAFCEISDTLTIVGVGDQKAEALGVYSICLPLHDGTNVTLSGVCMPKITSRLPIYPLGKVESDLRKWCTTDDSCRYLPKLSSKVGGDTDILIGSKYLRYFPKLVYEHESGLRVLKSVFKSPCGSRGVVEGPHPSFTEVERKFFGNQVNLSLKSYFVEPVQVIRSRWKRSRDVSLLGLKSHARPTSEFPLCCSHVDSVDKDILSLPDRSEETFSSESDVSTIDDSQDDSVPALSDSQISIPAALSSGWVCACKRPPKCVREFDALELTGTEVTYRCPICKECLRCKNGPRMESLSFQEEAEEALISRCVTVDLDKGISSARLPFVVEPDNRIAVTEQQQMALKVFQSQVRNLSTKDKERAAVIESERKLQELGFVDWLHNLSPEEQALIIELIQYLIPWRAVHNENSVSTPTRVVFDASQCPRNGSSLNSLLAKGANSLNKLIEIMIRWLTYVHAYHTDVSKMYNRVLLAPEHWRYQLYYWSENLLPGDHPLIKVIKTLIYGVRSSGNLAQCALRRVAELNRERYPKAFYPITANTYMDDCISGTNSPSESYDEADQIQNAAATGGFSVKGFVFSGEEPPEELCNGPGFKLIGGLKWFLVGDFIGLNVPELNFSRKHRGKKSSDDVGIIPEELSKLNCVSRSSEVFDLYGWVAPIMGGIKLDVTKLHKNCPKWEDPIPSQFKETWIQNFGVIDELRDLKYQRTVVPSDAANLDIETIEAADAGDELVCAAIYARFLRKGGDYSCQLILARTKVVHDLTTPRAELEAALLNASTGHIVRLSLNEKLKRSWKISDSQVALHWIHCVRYALKMWVRNRVVEINRLTELPSWRYVGRKDNISDLGTRKGAKISDVMPDSPWIRGYPWMREPEENFPLKKYEDICLSVKEKGDAGKEKVEVDLHDCFVSRYVPQEVGDRYAYSDYLIDPNKFRFRTVLRILALVFIFLEKINDKRNKRCNTEKSLAFLRERSFSICASQKEVGHYFCGFINLIVEPIALVVRISETMLNAAKAYFFEKASSEVIKFVDAKKYKNISTLNDGILYHTGRILLVQEVDGRSHISDACLDLSAGTFCVPITDVHSPVAYAVVAETHWYSPDVSHGGVESVLRYSQQTAFILGGRSLVKSMKKACPRCRFLEKKGIRVAMGPAPDDALRIAPVFYVSQVDICGPFSAFSPANKRATLKVWFVVFCCSVTGATDCRIMEDYSADGFVMAFIRFSCRFGYPKKLLPDEGSQLVKGCKDMVLSMSDISHKLHVEHGVEFETSPVGAHYHHGKVERKIQQVKKSFNKVMHGRRLSILQWETLGQQVSNSINNLPIGLGNKTEMLESLDILSPNRLLLGRNNCRSPTAPLEITHDVRRILESNKEIFTLWFKEWLVSFVPTLVEQPKWFVTDRAIAVGDVVLFLKSEKEFDLQYQYGIVVTTCEGKDGLIRSVDVEYQNPGESVKRRTRRGVRELVVIHAVDEIGISRELAEMANGPSDTDVQSIIPSGH